MHMNMPDVERELPARGKKATKKEKKTRRKVETRVQVLNFGALPPDERLDLVETQIAMRFRYRRVLTFLTRERERRKKVVYEQIAELRTALSHLERRQEVYQIALDALRDRKRNKPAKTKVAQFAAWEKACEKLAVHHDLMVARLREAERDWQTALRIVNARETGRPVEYAIASAEIRREARAAEKFAGWVVALLAVKHDMGGPNSRRRAEINASKIFGIWVQRVLAAPSFVEAIDDVERLYRYERKLTCQAVAAAGLPAGSYNAENEDFDAADKAARGHSTTPACPEFDRNGSIAVQISGGLSVEDLLASRSNDVRLVRQTTAETSRDRPHKPAPTNPKTIAKRWRVYLRVGSTGKRRKPVWASTKVTVHDWASTGSVAYDPLPKDAIVQRVRLVRSRVGAYSKWDLQFTLKRPCEPVAHTGRGKIAIDLGWRRFFDDEGTLVKTRVACWKDDRGGHGEVLLPKDVYEILDKVDDLRSIRDQHLEVIRKELLAYVRGVDCPDWLKKECRGLWNWHAPRRFVKVLREMRDRRFMFVRWDGDPANPLAAYVSDDRHLWLWQEHARTKAIGHRRETWRTFAARIAKEYAEVIIEGRKRFDLTTPKIAERPYPSDLENDENRAQRRTARRAAPGELRAAIVAACLKHGAKLVEVDPMQTTQHCHICGGEALADARANVVLSCAGCGASWDQDVNACINLLAVASGQVLPPPAAPFAVRKIAGESIDRAMRKEGKSTPPKSRRRDRSKEEVQDTNVVAVSTDAAASPAEQG